MEYLLKILKDIVSFNVSDVRPVIQKMNDEIKISRNIIRPYSNINIMKYLGQSFKILDNLSNNNENILSICIDEINDIFILKSLLLLYNTYIIEL